jgi:pyruvate-formate lyase-activating enzyme|tara:strand:+ start:3266 stop:4519 length:1254 start_codon:yes stop_codon:yes gene_type:complete
MSLPCYYALGGINFKNGYATSCPQQSDQLVILDDEYLPSKFFNSENFKKHRRELMSGQWSKGCDMCERVECANSGISMRQEQDTDLTHYCIDGSVDFAGLKTAEIRFSHSCNQACLHCSQVFSSGWMSKLKRYNSDNEDRQHRLHQLTGAMHRKSPDDDLTMSISTERALEIVEDLNTNFPNLERVDFAGGEVLYQKQFFPTLAKLAEHPNAENMLVMFHSNFNADFNPETLSNLLRKFGKSIIMISVDAGPRLYPYFRQGNWNKLKKNIAAFRAVNNKTEINAVCTTGTYQIMEIKDVFTGLLTLDVDFINSSIVFTPDYLNPALMLQHFKDQTLNDIEETRQCISNFIGAKDTAKSSALDALIRIKEYIINHQTEETHWDAFIVYIKKSDAIWNHNFNDHIVNFKYVNGGIIRNV